MLLTKFIVVFCLKNNVLIQCQVSLDRFSSDIEQISMSNIFYCHTGLVLVNAIATQDYIHDPTFRHSSPSVFMTGDLMLKLKTLYTRQHDVICQQDANILVANSYRHPY